MPDPTPTVPIPVSKPSFSDYYSKNISRDYSSASSPTYNHLILDDATQGKIDLTGKYGIQNLDSNTLKQIAGIGGYKVTTDANGRTVEDINGNGGSGLFNPDGTPKSGTNPNNPVTSSSGTRADVGALGADITGLTTASNDSKTLIQEQMDKLKADTDASIATLNSNYVTEGKTLADTQNKEYAGRSTNLITAGGGFLGTTESHAGVLQNLQNTFQQQKDALLQKRDAAIQAARSAYNDKNFQLATSLVKEAKDTEQEIYNRQKENANHQIQVATNARAEAEYQSGLLQKQAEAYSKLAPADYANISQAAKDKIDAAYFPGYMDGLNKAAQTLVATTAAKDAATLKKDAQDLEKQIMDLRLQTPAGKKFDFAGKTYTGLKVEKSTQGEITSNITNQLSSTIFSGAQLVGKDGKPVIDPASGAPVQQYTVPGTKGIPFIDSKGYATPEGWKAAIQASGMSRSAFIKQFGYLVPQSESSKDRTWASYGLTPAESKLLTAVVPVDTG